LKWEEIIELNRLRTSHHGRLVKYPKANRDDMSVNAGIGFIATGIKE